MANKYSNLIFTDWIDIPQNKFDYSLMKGNFTNENQIFNGCFTISKQPIIEGFIFNKQYFGTGIEFKLADLYSGVPVTPTPTPTPSVSAGSYIFIGFTSLNSGSANNTVVELV